MPVSHADKGRARRPGLSHCQIASGALCALRFAFKGDDLRRIAQPGADRLSLRGAAEQIRVGGVADLAGDDDRL